MEAAARGPGTRRARRSTALALRLGAALHRVGRRAGWGVAFTPTPRPSAGSPNAQGQAPTLLQDTAFPYPDLQESPSPHCPQDQTLF